MVLVEIFSGEECGLCRTAKETLLRLQQRFPFDLRETTLHEGEPLYDAMKERIPVIHINGAYACHYRVREEEFLNLLRAASAGRRE